MNKNVKTKTIEFTKEEVNKILQDPGWIKKDMTFTSELKTVQYLIQNHSNFDINLWGINGHTDLHTFVLNEKIEIVKYLLEIKGKRGSVNLQYLWKRKCTYGIKKI